ncbi:hypothetical protein QYN14_25745 [Rhodococcus ruber]|uniref:DUF7352 domain-containing protein n=1 Tax=Rhodococcus ruber TaxID=1830 RepID=UPI0026599E27|nr:hypothetical protein [Rhodococcus ruber]WKK11954.1 hypothetical protein QYN14_25330 [Rhodococcus ruber]WKK12037.1 hypothetical protein QYN14_25745 [Rhodococcus ruber]
MTRRVLRCTIAIDDYNTVTIPDDAKIVHAAPCRIQPNERIDVWYETSSPTQRLWTRIHVEGTGHPVAESTTHIGTVVCPNGLVWHLYLDNDPEESR